MLKMRNRLHFLNPCIRNGSLIVFFLFLLYNVQAQAFETNNVFIKLTLQEGGSAERIFSVSTQEGGTVNLELIGTSGASLNDNSVFLNKGEAKELTLRFNTAGLSPSIYIGSLKLSSAEDVAITPLILEVESKDMLFDANVDIFPNYREIFSGEEIIAQFKIFDLTSGGTTEGLGPTRVNVDYYIYDLNGQIVSSQSEEILVDKQVQLTKTFSFPPDLDSGDYVLAVKARYSSYMGLSSALFTIKEPGKKPFFGTFSFEAWPVYLPIGAFVFLIFIFIYFIHERNKILAELKLYHKAEMQQMRSFLHGHEKILRKNNTLIKPRIKQEIHKKIRALSMEHGRRESELKRLKQQGNIAEMRKKLAEWKQKGIHTRLSKYKLNEFGTHNAKKSNFHRRLGNYKGKRKKR